ncbi:hypothetical protein CLV51_101305 [Chitinophaga niastensis]|uniref:Uncharacterized protein n=1 Tax=Chitinophaga niastensis TaxID=536980 RepID=A0A2P8HS04_CHINA|nr:hypothetical protein CLV51_101305 [Chitinophaga niastensis]
MGSVRHSLLFKYWGTGYFEGSFVRNKQWMKTELKNTTNE